MANYRRNWVPGANYFFTVTLRDRHSSLLTDNIQLLRDAMRRTSRLHPFGIAAIVVLPEHLHAIWTMPEGVSDFAVRWRLIKSQFARALAPGEQISPSRAREHERGIWQRRYWEHTLRDEADFARHFDYIHFNPVKHGYVSEARQWPFSSFHRMLRLGIYPESWALEEGSRAEIGE